MKKVFPLHILITDLNHHVRNLLQRELAKAGHIIYTAGNKKEADEAISGKKPLDLIILDPELFEIFGESFFRALNDKMAKTKIIIHAFSDATPDISKEANIRFVEKNEKSIHSLIKIIQEYEFFI
ncbi:MAG: response regulator [Desulfamplus sp.]|nr:response regulator [Desulfamplus sp.]